MSTPTIDDPPEPTCSPEPTGSPDPNDSHADSRTTTIGHQLRRLARLLPTTDDYQGLSRSWRKDILAGLTVAVVALPLALAFGVASGLGATAGLITAIVAGAVAAVFGGSNFQVSGPTGAMAVVLLPLVGTYGTSAAITVAVIAGVLVILMGIFRFGRLLALVPWPVIEGFTVGIATIIVIQQVPFMLGLTPGGSDKTLVNAWDALQHVSADSLIPLGITSVTVIIFMAANRVRRSLPSSLIAIVVVTVLCFWLTLDTPLIGAIPHDLPAPSIPDLSPATVQLLFGAALAVAVLAALESLLSAKVADGMVDSKPTDPNRELVGQGLANVASGMFGGMPATGAIARTAVNVRAGASTRVAALVHSVVLLVIVLAASQLVGQIPLAALSGVLIVTCYRMVDPRIVLRLLRSPGADKYILGLTALATVAFDLVVAVEVGIVLAAIMALKSLAKNSRVTQEPLPDLSDHLDTETEHQYLSEHIAIYRIDGSIFFGAAQRFLDALSEVADVRVVILRMSGVTVLATTGANALSDVVADLNSRDITVILKGLKPEQEKLLNAMGIANADDSHCLCCQTLGEAITTARSTILH
ncbi:MAG: SulP family inorganic anion transporter [Candidatus Nanopelagicales bacterium]